MLSPIQIICDLQSLILAIHYDKFPSYFYLCLVNVNNLVVFYGKTAKHSFFYECTLGQIGVTADTRLLMLLRTKWKYVILEQCRAISLVELVSCFMYNVSLVTYQEVLKQWSTVTIPDSAPCGTRSNTWSADHFTVTYWRNDNTIFKCTYYNKHSSCLTCNRRNFKTLLLGRWAIRNVN